MTISYQSDTVPSEEDLIDLYQSVDWTEYTKDPLVLAEAVKSSLFVVTARHEGRMIGLARVVGDDLTIACLQDILVSPDYQRQGIGWELFRRVFQPFQGVRQKVLMTDGDDAQIAFYQSMGFSEVQDLARPISVFVKFD